MKTGITIVKAEYAGGYKIEITFSDGKVNVFDYTSLVMRQHEESIPYRDIEKFKNFATDSTSIYWGGSSDMILPLHTIYNKICFAKSGRKPISDKKLTLNLYINESIVSKNGGKEAFQKILTDYANSLK